MKLIIAGGRDLDIPPLAIRDYLLKNNIDAEDIECVVSGRCRGVDFSGEAFARMNKIKIEPFPPEWDKYGRIAGPIRNRKMARFGDVLLLIWNGRSDGSRDMKECMEKEGKRIIEVIV